MTSTFDTVTAISLRHLFCRRPDLKTSVISHPFIRWMVALTVKESLFVSSLPVLHFSELLGVDPSCASSIEVMQYNF